MSIDPRHLKAYLDTIDRYVAEIQELYKGGHHAIVNSAVDSFAAYLKVSREKAREIAGIAVA